ncbi:RdgB/HAM1 family non-canonical purine NTP pyrophosphatase [Halorussus pelagicus]|uniref:RdgB/HAM1 family non-canonical purine NTP pyrophosphatase n=1 Tax=Halorussus pelagicus TaxID=2505977 RepID=UPI000FFC30CC|nr:RdgB/HAM1 family non-canonical purine NTP pyrophosphatase [Halorussus pelagicus]
MTIRFVTSNAGKVREAREYLTDDVEQINYDYTEIQSDDLAEIATAGAKEAFAETGGDDPVVVDDAGLFVDALGGFPGPYSSYVEDTVGVERVWNLVEMEDSEATASEQSSGDEPRDANRRARFRCVVAYYDGEESKTFDGSVPGRIVAPRGDGGFGYDPIFEHEGETMAEMNTERKNAISHRGRALAKFADWLAENR